MISLAIGNFFQFGSPYFLAGRRFDTETGLYYYRARCYSTEIGRFLQIDPIGYKDSMNLYIYVRNNPTNYTDSQGLWFGIDDAIAAGGGAIVGLASQAISDLISGELSEWSDYGISALSGAAAGETLIYAGPVAAGAVGAGTYSALKRTRDWGQYERDDWGVVGFVGDVTIGAAIGKASSIIPSPGIQGITRGRGSHVAVGKQMFTKLQNDQIRRVSASTARKMMTYQLIEQSESGLIGGVYSGLKKRPVK